MSGPRGGWSRPRRASASRTLTLFAFSADNWKRPQAEVDGLMALLESFLRRHAATLSGRGVRLSLVGRRDRLSARLRLAAARVEAATSRARGLHLRLAVDYSARDMILRALRDDQAAAALDRDAFSRRLGAAYGGAGAPDVDLLIRTGGEQRLSDFLLWESAYAELCFLPRMWPDFGPADLAAAIGNFHTRERRFGSLPAARAVSPGRTLP